MDDYFVQQKKECIRNVIRNYDYYFLRAMHIINRQRQPEVLIAGSSHAMNGVVEGVLDYTTINFSISSQDLYYDFLNIRQALKNNSKVKICVVNIGYYMLYQDVSLSRNVSANIYNVYYPLFGDSHNLKVVDEKIKSFSGKAFEVMSDEWTEQFFSENPSYYGMILSRKNNNCFCKPEEEWAAISDEQRAEMARNRCNDHNRIIAHAESRVENEKLICEFVKEMTEKGISVAFVIFPFTKWYNQFIDWRYKEDILKCIESIPNVVHFLDMNEYSNLFTDEDFVNADHLGDQGAVKASLLLNSFLHNIGR